MAPGPERALGQDSAGARLAGKPFIPGRGRTARPRPGENGPRGAGAPAPAPRLRAVRAPDGTHPTAPLRDTCQRWVVPWRRCSYDTKNSQGTGTSGAGRPQGEGPHWDQGAGPRLSHPLCCLSRPPTGTPPAPSARGGGPQPCLPPVSPMVRVPSPVYSSLPDSGVPSPVPRPHPRLAAWGNELGGDTPGCTQCPVPLSHVVAHEQSRWVRELFLLVSRRLFVRGSPSARCPAVSDRGVPGGSHVPWSRAAVQTLKAHFPGRPLPSPSRGTPGGRGARLASGPRARG